MMMALGVHDGSGSGIGISSVKLTLIEEKMRHVTRSKAETCLPKATTTTNEKNMHRSLSLNRQGVTVNTTLDVGIFRVVRGK